jgi:hypothetical protein
MAHLSWQDAIASIKDHLAHCSTEEFAVWYETITGDDIRDEALEGVVNCLNMCDEDEVGHWYARICNNGQPINVQ